MAWIQLATWRYLGAVGMGQNEETGEWYAISALNSGGYDDLTYNTNEEATWADSKWKYLIKFALEYDSGSLTATSIKLRIRTLAESSSAWDTDYYYAYIGPQSDSKGTIVKVKDHGDTGTSAFGQPTGDTFIIKKERTATYFTIPTIWLMHTGGVAVATSGGVHTLTYDSTVNVYSLFNSGNRKNFKTVIPGFNQSSKSSVITIPIILDNSNGNAITITDKGNNIVKIKVPKFVIGTNNGIKPDANSTGERGYQGKYIFIEFLNSSGSSLAIYRRDFPNVTTDFSDEFNLLKGTAKISVWAKGVSAYGDDVEKSKLNHSVVYYTAPSAASSANLYYISDNKSSKADTFNPRLNKQLTWEWSGFSPGTANTQDAIKGFRFFLYKDPLLSSLTPGPTKYSYDSNHKLIVSSSNTLKGTSLPLLQNKPSNVTFDVICKDSSGNAIESGITITGTQTSATTTECIDIDIPSGKTTNGSGSFTIIPKEFGFEKNDYCICEVGAYSKDGAGNKLFNGYQEKSCKLRNSANVWVKVDDSKTLTGTAKLENDWVEAESIWVKVNNTGNLATDWVEAEGLWVKTDTNTWSESS